MVHDDYKEMIPARALSALDAAEERALNEHLENCAECRKELEDWQATAAALSLTPDPAEPSPQVRERILSEVRKDLSSSKPEVIPFTPKRNLWTSFGSLGAIAMFACRIAGSPSLNCVHVVPPSVDLKIPMPALPKPCPSMKLCCCDHSVA